MMLLSKWWAGAGPACRGSYYLMARPCNPLIMFTIVHQLHARTSPLLHTAHCCAVCSVQCAVCSVEYYMGFELPL